MKYHLRQRVTVFRAERERREIQVARRNVVLAFQERSRLEMMDATRALQDLMHQVAGHSSVPSANLDHNHLPRLLVSFAILEPTHRMELHALHVLITNFHPTAELFSAVLARPDKSRILTELVVRLVLLAPFQIKTMAANAKSAQMEK